MAVLGTLCYHEWYSRPGPWALAPRSHFLITEFVLIALDIYLMLLKGSILGRTPISGAGREWGVEEEELGTQSLPSLAVGPASEILPGSALHLHSGDHLTDSRVTL